MRWLNKQEIIIRNRHFSESIEVTRQNTATHPPYYVIKGNQRQTTVNSANLNFTLTNTYFSPNRSNLGLSRWRLQHARSGVSRYIYLNNENRTRK